MVQEAGEVKFVLPLPPSTNNLFINLPGRGRCISGEYQRWRDAADAAMRGMRMPKDGRGPWFITITVEDKGRRDIDNFAKAVLDHLVRHAIIEDDSRKFVRKLTVQFGDITGCEVEIMPA